MSLETLYFVSQIVAVVIIIATLFAMAAFMSGAVARAWRIAHREYPHERAFKKIMDDVVAEAEAAASAAAVKGTA